MTNCDSRVIVKIAPIVLFKKNFRSAPSNIASTVHRLDFLRQKHLLLASKAVCSKTICGGNNLIRRERDAKICHSSRCGQIVKYRAHGGPYKMRCAKLYAPAARLISAGVRVGMYTSIRKYWSARMQLCVFKTSPRKDEHTRSKAQPGSVRSVFRLNYFESWPISNEPWLGSDRTVKYETAYWYRSLSFGSPWINRFSAMSLPLLSSFLLIRVFRLPVIRVTRVGSLSKFHWRLLSIEFHVRDCDLFMRVRVKGIRAKVKKIWNDLFFHYP